MTDCLIVRLRKAADKSVGQARSQVLKFGGEKYIFRGARFLFLSYF